MAAAGGGSSGSAGPSGPGASGAPAVVSSPSTHGSGSSGSGGGSLPRPETSRAMYPAWAMSHRTRRVARLWRAELARGLMRRGFGIMATRPAASSVVREAAGTSYQWRAAASHP